MDSEGDMHERLAHLVGRRVAAIGQVFYVHKAAVEQSNSFLQLYLDGGLNAHLLPGGDGETLRVVLAPWDDPFREPLSDENRAFVQLSGKWTLFDVSNAPEMASLVGGTIRSVALVRDQRGTLRGVRLKVDHLMITYFVDYDEGLVFHGASLEPLREYSLHIDAFVPAASQ